MMCSSLRTWSDTWSICDNGWRFQIPPSSVDTLGGFVLEALGGIPSPGDQVEAGGCWIKVRLMEGQGIRRLQLARVAAPLDPYFEVRPS